MLSSAETIDVIAETLNIHRVPSIVLDPVYRALDIFICNNVLIKR